MERALDGGDGRLKLAAETMKGRGAGALLMGTNSSRYSGIPIHVRASGKCTAALRVLWDEHAKIKEHSKEKNEMHDVDVCHEEDASHLLQSNEVQLMEASCRDVKKHHLEAAVDLLDDFPILLIKSDVGDVIDALSPFEENLTKRVKISALQQVESEILAFHGNWVLLKSIHWGSSVWLADIFSTNEIQLPCLPTECSKSDQFGCFEKNNGRFSVCLTPSHMSGDRMSFCWTDSVSESWSVTNFQLGSDFACKVHCPVLWKHRAYWVARGDVYSCTLKDIKCHRNPEQDTFSVDNSYNLVVSDDILYMVQIQTDMIVVYRVDDVLCPVSSIGGRCWFLSAGVSGQLVTHNTQHKDKNFLGTGANLECCSFVVGSGSNLRERMEVLRRCPFSDICYCSSVWVISSKNRPGRCFGNLYEALPDGRHG